LSRFFRAPLSPGSPAVASMGVAGCREANWAILRKTGRHRRSALWTAPCRAKKKARAVAWERWIGAGECARVCWCRPHLYRDGCAMCCAGSPPTVYRSRWRVRRCRGRRRTGPLPRMLNLRRPQLGRRFFLNQSPTSTFTARGLVTGRRLAQQRSRPVLFKAWLSPGNRSRRSPDEAICSIALRGTSAGSR
jgi:hypothetical protein